MNKAEPTKKQALQLMAKYGVTFDKHKHCYDAPQGKVMPASGGLHYAVFTNYQGIIEDLAMGLSDCEETNCDICQESN